MKQASRIILWADALAFLGLLIFVLDAFFAERAEWLAWGQGLDNWSPEILVTWPPFWGHGLLIPKTAVAAAAVGCTLAFFVLLGYGVAWAVSKSKAMLLHRKLKAL